MRFTPTPLGGALCLVAVVQLPAVSWGCTPLHPAGLSLGLRRVGRRRRPRNGASLGSSATRRRRVSASSMSAPLEGCTNSLDGRRRDARHCSDAHRLKDWRSARRGANAAKPTSAGTTRRVPPAGLPPPTLRCGGSGSGRRPPTRTSRAGCRRRDSPSTPATSPATFANPASVARGRPKLALYGPDWYPINSASKNAGMGL